MSPSPRRILFAGDDNEGGNPQTERSDAVKRTLIIAASALAVSALAVSAIYTLAQEPDRPPPPGGGSSREGGRRRGGPQEDSTPLTREQRAKVKSILSRYDASALTAGDARAINEAFREAGLRNGPGLREAIREAGFVPERIGELDPPPDRPAGDRRRADRRRPDSRGRRPRRADRPGPGNSGGGYSIEQAVSDRAQLTTIAFSGLAFLTGNLCSDTVLPPGKVCDFFGFQYMRDVDTNELGHNSSFVPRIANNVLYVLSDRQKAQLIALAKKQQPLLRKYAYQRFPLIKAFRRLLAGDIPAGSRGLDRLAATRYTGELFQIDGQLGYERAKVLGSVVRSLSAKQKASLGKLAFNNSATWPRRRDQVDKRSLPHDVHVAVMTYASEMFSWYAGSAMADTYFCPERHGAYFGAFYMKRPPARGNRDESISTNLTADSGEAFLATLTRAQRELITGLVDLQRKDLAEIVKTRRAIAVKLRRFMREATADKDTVLALAKRYGELDGRISYYYATHFAKVNRTLSAQQRTKLMKLRNLDATYTCKGAYLYSRPIAMPTIRNTDFLFGG